MMGNVYFGGGVEGPTREIAQALIRLFTHEKMAYQKVQFEGEVQGSLEQ